MVGTLTRGYTRIHEKPPKNTEDDAPDAYVPLHVTDTFGWVRRRFGSERQSRDELVPGQHSSWAVTRNMRHLWRRHARTAKSNETYSQLWRTILEFVPTGEYTGLFLFLTLIVVTRVLQPTMFAVFLSSEPVLIYGSAVPWICFVTAGFWIAVSLESIVRSQYYFSAHLTSTSLKSGLTGLVYQKVLHSKQRSFADNSGSHIMNLVSTELDCIDQCACLSPVLFTAPIELFALSLLLIATVGWEATIGITYLLVCTLLRCCVGRVFEKLSQSTRIFTQRRLRLLSEAFAGIRAIKINVYEHVCERLIKDIRRKELFYVRSKCIVLATLASLQRAVPIIASFVSMATLMLMGKDLRTINAFLILLTMYILDESCGNAFVKGLEALVTTQANLRKIERFLLLDFPATSFFENTSDGLRQPGREGTRLHTKQADFRPGTPPLRNSPYLSLEGVCCEIENEVNHIELNYINFTLEGAQLLTITGPPNEGAGTSLVLEAILGEVPINRGHINRDGEVAYVSHKPWIFSGTLRENILFGEPYEDERYLAVTKACKLDQEIALLPNGDFTIIGQGGMRLNLGQQERVNLARAAYSTASIILLDNPLNHLNTMLADQIFEECIQGFLASRLRLLTTCRVDFLARSPHKLLMKDGFITSVGSLAQIQDYGVKLAWLETDDDHVQEDELTIEASHVDTSLTAQSTPGSPSDESEVQGFSAFLKYSRQAGPLPFVVAFGILLIAAPGAAFSRFGLLLARIERLSSVHELSNVHFHTLSALVGAFLSLLLVRAFIVSIFGLRSSKKIHERALSSLLRAPVQMFDATMQEALLKAFSTDITFLDETLPRNILRFFQVAVELIAAVIIINVSTPWVSLATIPAVVILVLIARSYLWLKQQARSSERTSFDLHMAHFADTIHGAVNTRAYRKESYILKEFHRLQDQYATAVCMQSAVDQWLALRYLAVTSMFMCIAAVTGLFTSEIALVALSLTYHRQLVKGITSIPLLLGDIRLGMSSVMRLLNYYDILPEVGYERDTKPPENWPSKGAVRIREDSEMTLDIGAGEKICIVKKKDGKKASFVSKMLLLNDSLVEVTVDKMPLKLFRPLEARKVFSVVEQKLFLFTASLRTNLDPEGIHQDGDLWFALKTVRLKDYVEELPKQLDHVLKHSSLFSVSQQVLLSLARALLQKRRIIIFDEITSRVDYYTTRIIRDAVNQQLQDCTVITIAYAPVSPDTTSYQDRVVIME